MEEKKQIEDLKGMTADDIIKVWTGFGNVEDAWTLGYLKERVWKRSPNTGVPNKWSVMRDMNKNKGEDKVNELNENLEAKLWAA